MATFAERLQKLRKEKNMTQPEFAEAIGKSLDTLKSWESERRTPRLKEAARIAEILGIKVDYLMGESFFRDDSEHSYRAFWNDDELTEVLADDINRMNMEAKLEIFNHIQDMKLSQPGAFVPEEDSRKTILLLIRRKDE